MNPKELKPLLTALATIKGQVESPGGGDVGLIATQCEVLAGASGREVGQAVAHWLKGGMLTARPAPLARDTGELSERPKLIFRPKA